MGIAASSGFFRVRSGTLSPTPGIRPDLDGHNRHGICQHNNLPFKTVEMEFADRDVAMLWVIDNQKGRRNLLDIDKIALAAKFEEITARKAKGNQAMPTGARHHSWQNCLK